MPLILGESRRGDADYLDTCRSKRNTAEYDSPGQVTAAEARELATFAVIAWLEKNHSGPSPWK